MNECQPSYIKVCAENYERLLHLPCVTSATILNEGDSTKVVLSLLSHSSAQNSQIAHNGDYVVRHRNGIWQKMDSKTFFKFIKKESGVCLL